jgi:hypothetical protein
MSRIRLRPSIIVPVALVAVAVLAVGLYLFQPWKLFVDTTVNEASPLDGIELIETTPTPVPDSAPQASPAVAAAPAPAPTSPGKKPKKATVISKGTFISHEHGTEGSAKVIQLADGTRVLRIENLDTSNGPDLKVWLSDADVIEGTDGWFVFDDGDYADLGALKGNKGNQNYEIPASVDLKDLTSVAIWCDRFSVSFGAAELRPVTA